MDIRNLFPVQLSYLDQTLTYFGISKILFNLSQVSSQEMSVFNQRPQERTVSNNLGGSKTVYLN